MLAAKNFQSGLQFVRQLEFALFDMHLHHDFDPAAGVTPLQLLERVRRQVAVVFPPEFNRFPNSFSHIFAGGYAAGYYSYKWAEVLSADAYSLFEEQGVLNPEVGAALLARDPGRRRQPPGAGIVRRLPRPRAAASTRCCATAAWPLLESAGFHDVTAEIRTCERIAWLLMPDRGCRRGRTPASCTAGSTRTARCTTPTSRRRPRPAAPSASGWATRPGDGPRCPTRCSRR